MKGGGEGIRKFTFYYVYRVEEEGEVGRGKRVFYFCFLGIGSCGCFCIIRVSGFVCGGEGV